jgi:hypothetical protein
LLTVTVGVAVTVTTEVALAVHVPFAPITVYVVVTPGLAVTTLPLVELKPVAGLHVYEVQPFAVKTALLPPHIPAELTDMVAVPTEFTVTVCETDVPQTALDTVAVYVPAHNALRLFVVWPPGAHE